MAKEIESNNLKMLRYNINELWQKRVRQNLMSDRPLDGIYCVYSMYWRPDIRRH